MVTHTGGTSPLVVSSRCGPSGMTCIRGGTYFFLTSAEAESAVRPAAHGTPDTFIFLLIIT